MNLKYQNQIFVVDYQDVEIGQQGKIVYTCNTIDEASCWVADNASQDDFDSGRYTIDGTPLAWREQTGE